MTIGVAADGGRGPKIASRGQAPEGSPALDTRKNKKVFFCRALAFTGKAERNDG